MFPFCYKINVFRNYYHDHRSSLTSLTCGLIFSIFHRSFLNSQYDEKQENGKTQTDWSDKPSQV